MLHGSTLYHLALPSTTGSTLCYWLYPLLLALPSTITGYTLSTQDLAVPVMYSLRLCKVLALMHNRMYIVNLVTHSSNAKMYGNHGCYTFYGIRRCTICGFSNAKMYVSNVRMYLLAQRDSTHAQ